jgi:hypothetical protein
MHFRVRTDSGQANSLQISSPLERDLGNLNRSHRRHAVFRGMVTLGKPQGYQGRKALG